MSSSRFVYDSEDNSALSALMSNPECENLKIAMKNCGKCFVNKSTSKELLCYAYRYCWWKIFLSVLGTICSGGFLILIFYWRADWLLLCTCSQTNWKTAKKVYLKTTDDSNEKFVSSIDCMSSTIANLLLSRYPKSPNAVHVRGNYGSNNINDDVPVIYFNHQLSKFIWSETAETFVEAEGLIGVASLSQLFHDASSYLDQQEVSLRRELFGSNLITVKIPAYFKLLVSEILNPFYVFQLFAVIFWMFDDYYIYATSILIISIISAIASLIQVRLERVRLHDMVQFHNEVKVGVLRGAGGAVEQIWSKDLVPGDVIVIPQKGAQLSCDAVLVSGTCIVNESMLTGESVPVTKTPLSQAPSDLPTSYDSDTHKRHTLFCGTEVMQTRFYPGERVKAVVVQSGFHTAKGRLVHSILFPKPVDLRLLRDAYRFVGVLFLMAMSGFIYTVVLMYYNEESGRDIFFNAVDLITISVPPALPLALTIGIIYAQLRLKRQKIHCISPQRINISGQIDVVAFDKTGTLTEDGLDLYSMLPVNHTSPEVAGRKFASPIFPGSEGSDLALSDPLLHCMATCHTLTLIDGKLTGDPLDVKMFEATRWHLMEPEVEDESKYDRVQSTFVRPPVSVLDAGPDSPEQLIDEPPEASRVFPRHDIGIVRQFPFSSSLQRCSVITKLYQSPPKEMMVFLKGAPETVAQLCLPETLPCDFHEMLKSYTQKGFRMIGLAFKDLHCTWLKAQKLERRMVESDLVFLGLIALENKLKPQSAKTLSKLRHANIRHLMVTGDNLLTSLSVARESGMIRPSDAVLVASTTPSSVDHCATLTWNLLDGASPSDSETLMNSFSSSEEKFSKNNKTVSICMGEQVPPTWHLAVTGSDFEVIEESFPEWGEVLAAKGSVFARMSPTQKTSLIESLQGIDYHVCMCGDGANDCGALKRAHAGLSLSEYEASVAAPFTSHTDLGIECVPTLIREGRAALVTSFGVFKFMALYSVIQFCSVTLLYNKSSNLGDLQYLYIDLIVIDFIALTMTRNHAHKTLDKRHPPNSLVSLEMLSSLLFQIALQCGAQVLVYLLVQEQCWHTDLTPSAAVNKTYANATTCPQIDHVPDQSQVFDPFDILTYSTSAIFIFSSFLYMSVSIAFSQGRPFRTPIYKNYFFLLSLFVLLFFNLFVLFLAPQPLDDFLLIRTIPDLNFQLLLLSIAAGHFLLAVGFEMLVVERLWIWSALRRICSCCFRNHVSKRYKTLLRHLNATFVIETDEGAGISPPNPWLLMDKPQTSKRSAVQITAETKTHL